MANDNIFDVHLAAAIIRVSPAIATVDKDISSFMTFLVRLLGTRSHRVGNHSGNSSRPKIDSCPACPCIPVAK